jgi:hypothetical protein
MLRRADMGTCFRGAGPDGGLFAGLWRISEKKDDFPRGWKTRRRDRLAAAI